LSPQLLTACCRPPRQARAALGSPLGAPVQGAAAARFPSRGPDRGFRQTSGWDVPVLVSHSTLQARARNTGVAVLSATWASRASRRRRRRSRRNGPRHSANATIPGRVPLALASPLPAAAPTRTPRCCRHPQLWVQAHLPLLLREASLPPLHGKRARLRPAQSR
jgi:hypothetical protein